MQNQLLKLTLTATDSLAFGLTLRTSCDLTHERKRVYFLKYFQ